jgi:hypothetical protein
VTITQILKDKKGLIALDDAFQEEDPVSLGELKQSAYHDYVAALYPLARGNGFSLTPLGSSRVEGRPALGIKVAAPDQPHVLLFFEASTYLMLRSEFRAKSGTPIKETIKAVVYGDYREVNLAAAAEQTLKEARLGTENRNLLEFLRSQVRTEVELEKLTALIRQLGDENFTVREQATAELIHLGAISLPFLRRAAAGDNEDPEVVRRAKTCLTKMVEVKGAEGPLAGALHLVTMRKPVGAVEVLLALAPSVIDEDLKRDLWTALAALAVPGGKPDPLLEKALQDKNPARRAAATAALGRDGGAFARQPGRRLFPVGLKKAFKYTQFQDGEKQAEWVITDLQFFNRLDDRVLAPPPALIRPRK